MKTYQLILAGAAILVGVPIGCSYLNTATNVATAPSRVINKTVRTDNIIFQYEKFFDIKSSYDSRLAQVLQYKGLFAAETDADEKRRLRIEMTAMQQSCRELANSYNNESKKINVSVFKSNNLPYELSVTDCEGNL